MKLVMQAELSVTLASVQEKEGGKRIDCVALCEAPGLCDVRAFMTLEKKPRVLKEVWHYFLQNSSGSFTVPQYKEEEE